MPSIKKLLGANGYSPVCFTLANQTNPGGASVAGPVTVSLATLFQDQFSNPLLPDPSNYTVTITPSQSNCAVSVTGKTTSGFSCVFSPIPSTATLASGVFDVLVIG
jgi:hypothetical protein